MPRHAPIPPLSEDQRRLASDNYPLARALARRFASATRSDPADCLSLAGWVLVRVARCWRPDRGVPFGAFAAFSIKRELRKWHAAEAARSERYRSQQEWDTGPDEEPVEVDLDPPLPIEPLLAAAGEHAEAVRLHYLCGLPMARVAGRLGLESRQGARYQITRGLAKMRAHLENQPTKPLPDDQRQQAVELKQSGATVRRIAEELSISTANVYRLFGNRLSEAREAVKRVVVDLRRSGMAVREIADRVGLDVTTIRKYLAGQAA